MKRCALPVVAACGCALLSAAAAHEAAAEPPVSLRAQSLECSYTAGEGMPQSTLRLHVRAKKGAALVCPAEGGAFASPLIGMDAAGRVMIGVFRTCETCLDNCLTLVYDFYSRPQGGWIEFNSSIRLRVSTGYTALHPVSFDPRRPAALQAGGMSFYCKPVPTPDDEADPLAVYFCMEYEANPAVYGMSFLDAEGRACPQRVLGGNYSERSGLTSATYLLKLKGERAGMQLRLFNPPVMQSVPVRFRAYMGVITDPAIGPD